MTVARTRTQPIHSRALEVGQLLTAAIIPLAGLASAAGLFVPGVYRRNATTIVPALQGQDLVTLLALAALAAALLAARRGSARGTLVWIGLLGYIFYTYAGAALGYAFGALCLLYVVLFSLSVFALIAAASGLDAAALQQRFDAATPRRPVAGFLILIALLLAGLELGQNLQFLASGTLPPGVAMAGGGSYFVYGMDLGLVLPLTILAAIWLWRRAPWGPVLAGFVLIKGATMGLALLGMNWLTARAGLPTDAPELMAFYALLSAGGLGMTAWFLRHCREEIQS
ncbi:MAG TPA: hypothetical protein VNL77_12160 [Roseiflexaceae bacterium]|nr:hypothetical protein [Roseiflexaceae bacterium]